MAGKAAPEPAVSVRRLLRERRAELKLRLVAGRTGLARAILQSRVQRPGLALSGYFEYLRYGRVQILGVSESTYLQKLSAVARRRLLARLAACDVTCFVVTKGLPPPRELVQAADSRGVPLLVTPLESTPFIKRLTAYLDEQLARRAQLHGVLVDVFGLGVLISGESGIGKSECALDLVDRGHGLVADDVVEVKRIGDTLVGTSPLLLRDHMELRGLGVINIRDLYGVSSLRVSQRVELVVDLERWEPGKEYDRLGLQQESVDVLGVDVPRLRMPVAPGRSLAILIEVAARNHLLKERGLDGAQRFAHRLEAIIAGPAADGFRRRAEPVAGPMGATSRTELLRPQAPTRRKAARGRA
ncbi:MAG: HPr(Ser) kinase/phosphatase [Vicinamibacteria bacterium]|nr:HPr(Ser) kinase/phosphatase [Vicinamibacteria bacterium]